MAKRDMQCNTIEAVLWPRASSGCRARRKVSSTVFDFEQQQRFRDAWDAVEIVRPVHTGLFTFGDTDLPYYLVTSAAAPEQTVSVVKGNVRVRRAMLWTPESAPTEFRNFFDDPDDAESAGFILSRQAAFSNLRFENVREHQQLVTDSVEEAVARLNRKLDGEDETLVAILTAPPALGGFAVLRYAAERVWASTPDNIQELRERGFLPD